MRGFVVTFSLTAMAGALALVVRLVAPDDRNPPPVLVAYGTSLTAAYDWTGALAKTVARCGFAVKAWNAGQGGADSRWAIKELDERVETRHPDIVLIEFAINDALAARQISLAESKANTLRLVDRLRHASPRVRILLMTMNPAVGEQARSRPDLASYYALYREAAHERGIELVDLYTDWQHVASIDPARLGRMLPDGLHPTFAAHLAVTVPGIAAVLAGTPCAAAARIR